MRGPAQLRAVLFDMDGTLLDSERVWDVSLAELAAEVGGVLSPQARQSIVGTSMARSMHLFHAALGVTDRDGAADAAWLDGRTGELFAEHLEWRPGAQELLLEVRRAGLRTALVTATSRPLVDIALETLGEEHFDVIVCGGETPAKPDPAPYTEALRRLALDAADALVIEDSPTGTASGLAAGCVVLAVPVAAPVAAQPRLTLRETLSGLGVTDLRSIWAAG